MPSSLALAVLFGLSAGALAFGTPPCTVFVPPKDSSSAPTSAFVSSTASDSACHAREQTIAVATDRFGGTAYEYTPSTQRCIVQISSSGAPLADVLPSCNSTTTQQVQAAVSSGAVSTGALAPTPSTVPIARGGRTPGCCQDVAGLSLLQTSLNTEATCSGQGALFAAGSPTPVKAFFSNATAWCTIVSPGSCAQYNATLQGSAQPSGGSLSECVTPDLVPSYAQYLLSQYNAIAALYASEAPAPAPATQAPAASGLFGPSISY